MNTPPQKNNQSRQIYLEPAYILHTRAYRNTSMLVDFYSKNRGRLCAVAKGVKRPSHPYRSILQPFIPLRISWVQGHSELVTMVHAETNESLPMLTGNPLLAGFYLNELLMRLWKHGDPCDGLFEIYHLTLMRLTESSEIEKLLRVFEKRLLLSMGYGLALDKDFRGESIEAESYYDYEDQKGFVQSKGVSKAQKHRYLGKHLLLFFQETLTDPKVLADAKKLMRRVLRPLLGEKPLASRKLFGRIPHF